MMLKELCTLEVACCTRETTITAASRLMREHHTGDLIVLDDLVDERRPAGMITDRDIVTKVIAAGLDPARTSVGAVMTSPLVIASAREDTSSALERMRSHGVRRLPITDDHGRVIGIVTLDDLLRDHAERAQTLLAIVTSEQDHERRRSS